MKLIEKGFTPLYEFVWTEKYPHIVSYSQPKLHLLAFRNIYSGEYHFPDERFVVEPISDMPKIYGEDMKLDEVKELLQNKKKNFEGFTIFNEYDFYKIKTEWYLQLHKTIDEIDSSPKRVIELILIEELDDLKSLLATHGLFRHLKRIEKIEYEFWKIYEEVLTEVDSLFKNLKDLERKEFFLKIDEVLKNIIPKEKQNLIRYLLISKYLGRKDKNREIKLWVDHVRKKLENLV